MGTDWGSPREELTVRTQLETAAAGAHERAVPMLLGEFGTYEVAPFEARVRWTRAVRRAAEPLGMAWCYWDFATDFGVLDARNRMWRVSLLDALTND